MTPATWTLGRRITTLCAFVAALLGLIAVSAAITAAANRTDVNRVIAHVGPARSNSERLLAALYREQSAVRTFALTGRPEDLTPYNDALADERQVVAATRDLLRDEARLDSLLTRVSVASDAYRQDIAEKVIAAVRTNGPSADLATPNDLARTRFRAATDAVSALQQSLTSVRDKARTAAEQTGNVLILLLIIAAVVVVIAGFALAALLRRLVTRPVVDLAAEVRLVAHGDYGHEIHSVGPPELARLARDVNGMRQQIANDLSEVRQARGQIEEVNLRLEQQAEELTRSNRDLEQFAYVASHDLQEPLRKVASFCQLLQRRYQGQLDERADQYIGFAVDGAQRMQRLINDLLAFSRIGRLTNGFTEVDLNKVVLDASGQFDTLRAQTGAEITFENLPCVLGEEPLLGALFANLVGNAIKFRHPDRTPTVHLAAKLVGNEYEISCEDNGIGIAPEFVDKVFVIFQRLHAKETYPGTGIGLAIAKKIVEYHGGRIWIDTEHREGTLFRFTLPMAPSAAPREAEPTAPLPAEETVS
jgi:signal transduction histidine kinase